MIEYLKRYWFAKVVCRKYKIIFVPDSMVGKSCASYTIQWEGKAHIYVPLDYKNFYEAFFHELGHILDYRRNYGCTKGRYERYEGAKLGRGSINVATQTEKPCKGLWLQDYGALLVNEAVASRYAIKALKATNKLRSDSVSSLLKGYESYLRHIDQRYIAHYHTKIVKYFNGEVNILF